MISIECNKEPARHVRDACEITPDSPVASNVSFEYFPVVYAVLPRLPCIAENQTALEFVEIATDLFASFAPRFQMNRAGTAKSGGIVILRSRGRANHDSFRVAADVDPIFQTQGRASEPIERGANGHRHRTRTADARASGRLRIGRQRQPQARPKETYQVSE